MLATAPDRLAASDRREALLDVAKELVLERGAGAVTMGRVADRAEVTRALVYKHFANKDELLRSLYRREATTVDRLIRHEVAAAPAGFETKFSAYVAGVVAHVADLAPVFGPLHDASAHKGFSSTQQQWDRRTVSYFADLAAERFGLDSAEARSAVSMILGGINPLIGQVRATPSAAKRASLEARYVRLAAGALAALASADQ